MTTAQDMRRWLLDDLHDKGTCYDGPDCEHDRALAAIEAAAATAERDRLQPRLDAAERIYRAVTKTATGSNIDDWIEYRAAIAAWKEGETT